MPKTILVAPYLRKAVTAIASPSPELPELASLNPKPRHIVNIRKLKSEQVAKVATVLDFNDDY